MKIRSTDLSREWCKPRKIMDHQFFYVLQNIQSGLTDSLLAKRWFWNWFVDSLGDFRFGFAFNALQFRFLHNSPCASWSLASSTITKSSNCQGSGLVGNHRQLLSCLCLAGTSNPPLCQLIMSQPAPLITDIIGMMGRPLATIDKAKLSASRWIWIPDTHLQDPNPPNLISSHLYTFWETWLLWKKKKNQILVCLTSLTMGGVHAYRHYWYFQKCLLPPPLPSLFIWFSPPFIVPLSRYDLISSIFCQPNILWGRRTFAFKGRSFTGAVGLALNQMIFPLLMFFGHQ